MFFKIFGNFLEFSLFYILGTTLHDPEGILGHLTSCYLTYLGLQAGKWFSYYPNFKEKKQFRLLAGHFIAGALIIGTIGTILDRFHFRWCTNSVIEIGNVV